MTSNTGSREPQRPQQQPMSRGPTEDKGMRQEPKSLHRCDGKHVLSLLCTEFVVTTAAGKATAISANAYATVVTTAAGEATAISANANATAISANGNATLLTTCQRMPLTGYKGRCLAGRGAARSRRPDCKGKQATQPTTSLDDRPTCDAMQTPRSLQLTATCIYARACCLLLPAALLSAACCLLPCVCCCCCSSLLHCACCLPLLLLLPLPPAAACCCWLTVLPDSVCAACLAAWLPGRLPGCLPGCDGTPSSLF